MRRHINLNLSTRAPEGQRLTREGLQRVAPAIFAAEPSASRSDRYAFIPTITVVEALVSAGLVPVFAASKRSADREHTKHVIRFRYKQAAGQPLRVGDSVPEVALYNSHDGGGAYQLYLGFLRLVCTNGLTVMSSDIGAMNVRHVGRDTPRLVVEKSLELIDRLPAAAADIQLMERTHLTQPEQRSFARAALALRWDPVKRREQLEAKAHERGLDPQRYIGSSVSLGIIDAPISADQLLTPHRAQDHGDNLWCVFNRVQENLVRGGQRGRTALNRPTVVQPVRGLDRDLELNRSLWQLASGIALNKQAPRAVSGEGAAQAALPL